MLADAAAMLGKTKKAVEQLVHRGSLRSAVEKDPKSGRTRRRVTTPPLSQAVSLGVTLPEPEQAGSDYWRKLAEDLAHENVTLQFRIRELEAQLRRRRT